MNAQTAVWAAEHGINIVGNGPAPDIRRITDVYRSRWAVTAAPGAARPMLGVVRRIVIAESDRGTLELAAPAYARWFDTLTYLYRDRRIAVPPNLKLPYPEAVAAGLCMAGSPSTVRDRLLAQIRTAGVNYVMFLLAFGSLPLSVSLKTIAHTAAEIIPAFERITRPHGQRRRG
jgi:alkanesulfonate monooxygenase SsuD/methylene tetrahydromethanopterin reductase-like flavin-dependent oxidoreductase (luciferase family)